MRMSKYQKYIRIRYLDIWRAFTEIAAGDKTSISVIRKHTKKSRNVKKENITYT